MTAQIETTKAEGSLLAGRTLGYAGRLNRLLTFSWDPGGTPCAY